MARELGADLDVVLSRKLRPPGHPELAIGAVSEEGSVYYNRRAWQFLDLMEEYLAEERDQQMAASTWHFLVTTLGEIPDRHAVLAQCYRVLKPGGVLSITEMLPDPHYQSRSTVKRLAESVGFRLESVLGGWWLFTATFVKLEHISYSTNDKVQ